MVSTHWTADDGSLGFSSWSDAVVIRSKSLTERPKPLEHDTVNHDAYRVSFFVAWYEKKKKLGKSTTDFEKGSRCFRVRYEYLPGEEQVERRKWQLCQEAFTGAQVQTLVGLRRAQAVQEVERLLQKNGKAASAADLEGWFKNGLLTLTMSEKTIRAMLRIARRFGSVMPDGPLIIAELDSKFQSDHCLAGHTNLDLLCSRTSIPKNQPLENARMMWVLEALREDICKGALDHNVGGTLLGSIISMYLLKRRVILHQVKKFGAAHPDFGKTFESMQSFKKSGLDVQQASCMEWLRQAPDYVVESVTFSVKVLKGHKAMDELFLKLATSDPKMSPEGALLELEKAGLHDHRAVVGLMEDAKHPPVSEEAAPTEVSPPEVSAPDVPEDMPEDMGEQAADNKADAAETKGVDRLQAFPHLKHHMSDLLHDIIYKNPDDSKFSSVLDDAIIRRNTYVQLHVTPEDSSEWQMLLKGLRLPDQGRLHKIDAKAMHQGPAPGGRFIGAGRSLTTVFGDLGPGTQGIVSETDLVLIFDGRVPRNQSSITRELSKGVRRPPDVQVVQWPLENVSMVWTSNVGLELRERKFVDLPGSNKARGWAGQSIKGDEDYLVSLLPRECLQAMADGKDAPKAPHSDSEEESAPEDKDKDTAEVSSVLPLHPWESTEEQAREIFHCFLPNKASVVIAARLMNDYFAGLVSAVACARDKIRYVGFVKNQTSLCVLSEMILLRIVLEMVQDRSDGFRRATRHLSKSLSLRGESAPSASFHSPFSAGSPKLEKEEDQERLSDSEKSGAAED
ncbi:unnamed protein product [Symbiodinium sp. CCMP2592]|nr:unnamed protein product [Symbiodinium sp. CCMP2592]